MNFAKYLLSWFLLLFFLSFAVCSFWVGNYTLGTCGLLALVMCLVPLLWDVIVLQMTVHGGARKVTSYVPTSPSYLSQATRLAQPHVLHGVQKLGGLGTLHAKWGTTFTNFAWGHYQMRPCMWSGILALLCAAKLFLDTYLTMDWHPFHGGLVLLATGAGLLLHHFGKLGIMLRIITNNLTISWAVTSVAGLLVAAGHGWWGIALAFVLSFVAAVIAFMKKWKAVAGWVLEPLLNKRGPLATVISRGVLLTAITLFVYYKNETSGGNLQGLLYMSMAAYVLVIIFGFGKVILPSKKK